MLNALQDEPERRTRWLNLSLGVIIASLLQVGGFVGVSQIEKPKRERRKPAVVKIVMAPKPKPKPKPKVEEPKPKPKPKPKKKKKRRRRKKQPKPQAQQPSPKPPPKKPAPRLIQGLNFKSTVKGGKGPTFQVGNTVFGKPKAKFTEPVTERVSKGPKTREGVPEATYIPPKLKRKVKPTYTVEALASGIEGRLSLMISIDTKGRVYAAKIKGKKLGYGLDQVALKTVKLWRYAPAMLNGKPVKSEKPITMNFVIED